MAEEVVDVAADTNADVEETTNSNENSEQEDTVDLAAELEKQHIANSQINARAKKAEAELKKLKEAQAEIPLNKDPQLSDELKLIARGLSDEEIDKAKVVAKGLGISLPEAIKDPLFLSYQATLKEKERKEKAKLGASKGSGESEDSTLIKQGMTREEHEKAFKKVMGI
ncbi:hypothetical protein M0R04_13865 [Candidatus Dojkabacteria bacterium]|jgi:hypothetical protein|nr:hypothetical protein [Candidatus Dojkabacteria bacterium]